MSAPGFLDAGLPGLHVVYKTHVPLFSVAPCELVKPLEAVSDHFRLIPTHRHCKFGSNYINYITSPCLNSPNCKTETITCAPWGCWDELALHVKCLEHYKYVCSHYYLLLLEKE